MILFIEEGMFSPDEAERGDELEGLLSAEAEKKIAELSAESHNIRSGEVWAEKENLQASDSAGKDEDG